MQSCADDESPTRGVDNISSARGADDMRMTSVTDPGFPPGGGVNPPGGGVNTQFCQILPKTAMKLKEFGRPGGPCVPRTPP